MAAGVDVTTTSNPWVITYNGSTATHTLPFNLWPGAADGNQQQPFIAQRIIWVAVSAAGGNQVILTDINGVKIAEFVATGADYMPPQEWKHATHEGSPNGCIITQFDAGRLYIHI